MQASHAPLITCKYHHPSIKHILLLDWTSSSGMSTEIPRTNISFRRVNRGDNWIPSEITVSLLEERQRGKLDSVLITIGEITMGLL